MLRRIAGVTLIFLYYLTTTALIINGQRHNNIGRGPQVSRVDYDAKEEERVRETKSKDIQKYMNLSVDPCNDFYEYACGMWNEVYKEEGDVTSQEYQLEQEILENLQSLIVKSRPGPETQSLQKIKNFYDSCIQERAQSQNQHNFYMDFIRRHGGLPDVVGTNWNQQYNWEFVVADLRVNYGMDILIGLKIEPSMENTRGGGYRLYIDEPVLKLLPEELCSAEALTKADEMENSFENIQEDIAKNLGNWFKLREAESARIAGDIVRFEFELCKQIHADQLIVDEEVPEENEVAGRTQGRGPNRLGQSRLHNNYNEHQYHQYLFLNPQQLTKRFQQISFINYVNTIFPPQFTDQIYLRSEAYFTNLAKLLRQAKKPTLAYYIMYNAISELSFPQDDRPRTRPKFCTELAISYFPQHFGEIYYRMYYNEILREDIENIYQKVDEAFTESFGVEWLGDNFKRAAQQKLTRFKVRFPAYENLNLEELVIENLHYWQKLERIMKYNAKQELNKLSGYANRQSEKVVEAYDLEVGLENRENEVQIGLGLLRPPFYQLYYGNSLKYSFVGQLIASTLVSAFDEKGWNKDPQSPMQWDEITTDGFRNSSQCFRTQYSHYLYNNPDEFRNAVKLREFIGQCSGLNIAFRAYLIWLTTMETRDRTLQKETLPDINFTNTQLFFVNFAQARCATTANSDQNRFPMDWHTEERFNVNGPLSNFIEFAREFNCAPGSQMNPDDKCILF